MAVAMLRSGRPSNVRSRPRVFRTKNRSAAAGDDKPRQAGECIGDKHEAAYSAGGPENDCLAVSNDASASKHCNSRHAVVFSLSS